jgi:Rrf2 family protein
MAKIFSMSEAASIGIHSMVLIARAGNGINAVKIAETTGLSKNHISKVLQRLVKNDLLKSVRGPSGGFTLKRQPENISLLDVYETIEGSVEITDCPLAHDICGFDLCIMGSVVNRMAIEFRKFWLNKH